jgi:hypothetical protein
MPPWQAQGIKWSKQNVSALWLNSRFRGIPCSPEGPKSDTAVFDAWFACPPLEFLDLVPLQLPLER